MIRYILLTITVTIFNRFDIFAQSEFSVGLYGSARNRLVSVTICTLPIVNSNTKSIIFNDGYNGNKNVNSNKTQAYRTRSLTEKGHYVISIQRDLPDDKLLSMKESFMSSRMLFWEKGETNIIFVIAGFLEFTPDMDWKSLVLIGHSDGGDMSNAWSN